MATPQGSEDSSKPQSSPGPSGWRIESMARAAGALIGLVPGLLVWVVGIPLTDGDDLLNFIVPGVVLAFVGFVGGLFWGMKATGWLRDHLVGSLVAGLSAVAVLVGVLFSFGG